jgi:hypothetical protein
METIRHSYIYVTGLDGLARWMGGHRRLPSAHSPIGVTAWVLTGIGCFRRPYPQPLRPCVTSQDLGGLERLTPSFPEPTAAVALRPQEQPVPADDHGDYAQAAAGGRRPAAGG